MTFFENAQKILDYISEQAGIDRFELDEEGRAFFEANGMTFLFYALEEENTLVPVIYIGQPDLDNTEFLYLLLCGNHIWEKTGGGSLSIDPDTGHLCLQHGIQIPLADASDIEPIFGSLLGAAEYWRGVMDRSEDSVNPGEPGPENQNFIRV